MRENYSMKLIIIALVFLMAAYEAVPSMGVFPDVEDFDGNGMYTEVDFREYHRRQLEKDEAFMAKYDTNKDGQLLGAEWDTAYSQEKTSRGLDGDPRWLSRFFSQKRVTLGLDLQGGIDLVYEVVPDTELKSSHEQTALIKKTIQVLKNRIDILGITEPVVQRYDLNKIRVQLAGRFDEAQVKSIIGQTDLLKFQEVIDSSESALKFGSRAQDPQYQILRQTDQVDREGNKTESGVWYLLKRIPVVKGDEIASAFPRFNEFGKPEIGLTFKPDGAKQLAKATKNMVGRQLAIVLGGEVYMAPTVQSQLSTDVTVEGQFDLDYVRNIVDVLKAGSLPATLVPKLENRIGATLGQDSVERGFKAGEYGFALVFLLMLVWYKASGIFALLALLFNLVLMVAIMVFMGATLTLPGIAGLILTVGMAVDANVIIFERIKEELKAGKSIRAAIDVGFAKAFSAIIDSNVTSLFTCAVLFKFGSGPIQGFAVTLAIGIFASMFTAIFVVKTLLGWWYAKSEAKVISI